MTYESTPRRRATAVFALATAGLLLVGGCSKPAPTSSAPKSRYPFPTVYAGVSRLSPEQNRVRIDATFPGEVPVPAGKVLVGEALSTSSWDYQLEIPASSREVVAWYAAAYPGEGWELVQDESATDGGARRLEFRKTGAESAVLVEPVSDDLARATVTVGYEEPLPPTQ
jgi:hypothetical protein